MKRKSGNERGRECENGGESDSDSESERGRER